MTVHFDPTSTDINPALHAHMSQHEMAETALQFYRKLPDSNGMGGFERVNRLEKAVSVILMGHVEQTAMISDLLERNAALSEVLDRLISGMIEHVSTTDMRLQATAQALAIMGKHVFEKPTDDHVSPLVKMMAESGRPIHDDEDRPVPEASLDAALTATVGIKPLIMNNGTSEVSLTFPNSDHTIINEQGMAGFLLPSDPSNVEATIDYLADTVTTMWSDALISDELSDVFLDIVETILSGGVPAPDDFMKIAFNDLWTEEFDASMAYWWDNGKEPGYFAFNIDQHPNVEGVLLATLWRILFVVSHDLLIGRVMEKIAGHLPPSLR